MTDATPSDMPRPERSVALLAAHWDSSSEEGWIARQVAGALATVADVHIITPDGEVPGPARDSVFTVHHLATPLLRTAELRRDLLVSALAETGVGWKESNAGNVIAVVDQDLVHPWNGASSVLRRLQPELVVVAGHQHVGALVALDRYDPDVAMSLLALGSDLNSLTFPHFRQLFQRARSVLTVTGTEHDAVVDHYGRPADVGQIGAPLFANPSALTEPDTSVGETEYILVLTDVDSHEEHWENELSQLLRMRFPKNPVAISHRDAVMAWHQGRLDKGPPVGRSSDLARLMAWARVTVDLRPGRLFARRCLESLLYGTPIIVPDNSRAREHAERGRSGLWFSNASELTWCTEALLDPANRAPFSAQGQAYADDAYGSTDRFIGRVLDACGLTSSASESLAG
jgi:hypothetical protein